MPVLGAPLGIAILLFGLSPSALGATEDPAVESMSPSKVQTLISRLTTDDEWQREATLKEIAPYLQQENSELLARILGLLNGDLTQRRIAVKTLKTFLSSLTNESIRRDIANAVLPRLSDPDDYVRSASVEILERYLARARAAETLPLLKTAFERESQTATKGRLLNLIIRMTTAVDHPTDSEHLLEQVLSQPGSPPELRSEALSQLSSKPLLALGGFRTILEFLKDDRQDPSVRLAAISALSKAYLAGKDPFLKDQAKKASEALAVVLKDSSQPQAQALAAVALSNMGPLATSAVDPLRDTLASSKSERVRINCARALGRIGETARSAIPELVAALDGGSSAFKVAAITSLGRLNKKDEKAQETDKESASRVVTTLRERLRTDPDIAVRMAAVGALGEIASPEAIPELRIALRKGTDVKLQMSAVKAVGKLREAAKDAEGDLRTFLASDDWLLSMAAAEALKNIGADSTETVRALAARYESLYTADTLGDIGRRNPEAIRVLTEKLSEEETRGRALASIQNAALGLRNEIKKGSSPELAGKILIELKNAVQKLKGLELSKDGRNSLETLQTTTEDIERELRPRWWQKVLTSPWFLVPAAYLAFLLSVFWLAPLWLLSLDRALEPLSVKIPWLDGKIGARKLLLLQYHPRVLDAWVQSHVGVSRLNFGERKTVKDREFHVPSPVVLDGKGLSELLPRNLREVFAQPQARILIWGEGGAGKTSLACLLARWAMAELPSDRLAPHWMIPILLEDELEVPPKGKHQDALLTVVRGQLQAMVGSKEPIPQTLFERLLRQRRVLVIVDHLSEMNEDMQKAVRPESPDFPINALVVTARTESVIGTAHAKKITPMRIQGDRTASFMEAYLSLQEKREIFADSEFFEACAHLSRMVGKRNITVLLARLYADRLIELKEGNGGEELPSNIPDLMLSYLNELNRTVSQDRLDEREVHKAVSRLAWHCIETTFRPAPAVRDKVLAALGADGEKTLEYLEQRLRIVITVGAARNQVRISLDPLAEYMAGIYLCEHSLGSEVGQKRFLGNARAMAGSPAEIEGFLLAVHDCYLARIPSAKEGDPFLVTLRDLLTPVEAPSRAA